VIVTPAGKNIYPEDLEAVLDASPLVLECAVVPRQKSTGQEPIAVVVPDFEFIEERFPDEKLSDEELRQLMRLEVSELCEQLSDFKRVKDVIVLTEELPKTSTRKVKRHALIDSLQQLGEI
jgi:long-chain acyl-CoA synthetase